MEVGVPSQPVLADSWPQGSMYMCNHLHKRYSEFPGVALTATDKKGSVSPSEVLQNDLGFPPRDVAMIPSVSGGEKG